MKKLCIRWEEVEKTEKENHKKQRKHGLAKRLTALGMTFVLLGATSIAANNYTLEQVNYPIYINGTQQTTDKPVLNLDGSTYVPLRFVGEGSGLEVNWVGEKSEIWIENTASVDLKSYMSACIAYYDLFKNAKSLYNWRQDYIKEVKTCYANHTSYPENSFNVMKGMANSSEVYEIFEPYYAAFENSSVPEIRGLVNEFKEDVDGLIQALDGWVSELETIYQAGANLTEEQCNEISLVSNPNSSKMLHASLSAAERFKELSSKALNY